jgi:hypothetical protein
LKADVYDIHAPREFGGVMPVRNICDEAGATDTAAGELVLRSGPNWTAVAFFGGLGALHLTIWGMALMHRRWEGYMSLLFGAAFSLVAVGFYLTRGEIAVLSGQRRMRLRTGYRRLRIERFVPFTAIRSIRLTTAHDPDHAAGLVEIVCREEVIECPATAVARQEALCLAMTIGVTLVKVSSDTPFPGRSEQMPM